MNEERFFSKNVYEFCFYMLSVGLIVSSGVLLSNSFIENKTILTIIYLFVSIIIFTLFKGLNELIENSFKKREGEDE